LYNLQSLSPLSSLLYTPSPSALRLISSSILLINAGKPSPTYQSGKIAALQGTRFKSPLSRLPENAQLRQPAVKKVKTQRDTPNINAASLSRNR
jgi:hypothetical protein